MSTLLKINDHLVPFTHRRVRRAKNLRLLLSNEGKLTITRPWYVSESAATKFLHQNIAWIAQQLSKLSTLPKPTTYTKQQLVEMKIKTRNLVRQRLIHFNQHYQYTYLRLTIRNQKTRWGSCSSNKTLSFNCRLCLLPPALSDYVIVHELCHLKEMNHSSRFWNLVAQTIPLYKTSRRYLGTYAKLL